MGDGHRTVRKSGGVLAYSPAPAGLLASRQGNMIERLIGHLTRAAEAGRLPDALVRAGIRYNVASRGAELRRLDAARHTAEFIREMDTSPIALVPEMANRQHYEVPAAFFERVLGPRRKYSGCLWGDGTCTLQHAEENALQQVTERARVEDGMRLLDLGCGWGSLTLWLAERFPNATVIAVSNARSQAEFIRAEAKRRGLPGIEVRTADMNDFDPGATFDRILSIEMFEHMRNWRRLFGRVADWLTPDGRFFLHVFSHRNTPYPYLDRGEGDWMSRFFFSGGMMPSHDLATHFQERLTLEERWWLDGTHYNRTANAWLQRFDESDDSIRDLFQRVYGHDAELWRVRWRIFFMACAEMFATDAGQTWGISHYRFRRRPE